VIVNAVTGTYGEASEADLTVSPMLRTMAVLEGRILGDDNFADKALN
jgi:hypothetical protein